MDQAFPPGEGIAEFSAGRQSGRTRGQNPNLWKRIRPDFQQPAGVPELMNLIKDHDGTVTISVKQFGVGHHVPHGRQVAVDIMDSVDAEALGQRGLS
jgi:hypothetical protein